MKCINTWVNEKQYEMFLKRAKKKGATPYAVTKGLVLQFLYAERQREISTTAFYWYLIYSLAVATLIFAL